MPYRYLDDVAISDAAIEVWGKSIEELFLSAAEATLQLMVDDISSVRKNERLHIETEASGLDLLLFNFLGELIFYKDARRLFLIPEKIEILEKEGGYRLTAELRGETIDPARHSLASDVKAVTLHRLAVKKINGEWEGSLVLDI